MLQNAICLLRSCDHRALPRLHNAVESLRGPLLVYEWIEDELVRGRP
jgi:hypothetical protein